MKQKMIYILVTVLMLITINTMPTFAATGTINTETLNLRKEASTSSDIIEQINKDEEVEILSEENGWYKVNYKEYTGYVSKDYVTLHEEENIPATVTQNEEETTIVETTSNNDDNTLKSKTKIRIIPTINSKIIGELEEGAQIDIIAKTNNWAFVGYRDITGWIPLITLKEKISELENNTNEIKEENEEPETKQEETEEDQNQEQEVEQEQQGETQVEQTSSLDTLYNNSIIKYINSSSVRVRSKPTTESDIVTSLIKNTDVTVVGENGDWYKVKYDYFDGYIRKDLLSDEKQETTSRSDVDREENKVIETTANETLGEQIVSYAKQYLGCPYVYGGAGSSSFDCSGFTMYVYKHFGFNLSHSALAQSRTGTYIAKEDLRPGDLVFFLEYQTMDEVGHCGIYIGNGEFIHASSGTGYCVKISDLTTGSYLKRYDSARRLY